MPYRQKLKRENKEVKLENRQLKSALFARTKLFVKHDLLPKIAMTECLCKGKAPICARCAARDILVRAGFRLKEKKPKSNLILPNNQNIIAPD